MAFWFGILIGGLFAWLAVKIGFYETWAMLFNIVVSVYLAIFLRPVIATIAPAAGGTAYGGVLTVLATALACFAILHGISYVYFTSQFNVSFPKVLNVVAAGCLGFLAGLLIWSFVSILIYISPISQNSLVRDIGFDSQYRQTSVSYTSWWCNRINSLVGTKRPRYTTEQFLNELFEEAEKRAADANKPSATGNP